jgi:uncharacterized protein (DUF58 family)
MPADDHARALLDPAVLARLGALPLAARRAMQGSVSGRHASPHRGASVEFAEYRKYVPGDDLRRLDWRAYGRTDRHYVKEYEADTNLRCLVVLDASGSMGFGSGPLTKFAYAQRLAAAAACLAIRQGDAAGATCVADGLEATVPPRRNPAHLTAIANLLAGVRPRGAGRLVPALHELAETTPQRALFVVVSDFFVDPRELRGCFEHFRFRRHDLAAFHLLDPLELTFPLHRPVRFLDMEGGPALLADPAEIADRYLASLQRYLESVRQAALETEIDYQRVSLATDYEQTLQRFLLGRVRSGGVR